MGNTMPQTVPNRANGSAAFRNRANRLGTIRFSAVVMPDFRSSASANGRAVCLSLRAIGMRYPVWVFSFQRNITRQISVRQPPMPLPATTAIQAFPGLVPAQKDNSPMVTAIDRACSATSTAARVPMRLAAVKYPTITPVRQHTGKKAANSRTAGVASILPIQFSDIQGARICKHKPIVQLKIRLYMVQPEITQVTFLGRPLPSSSAVRYMVAVRIPAMPAVIARLPTESTNCRRPIPAAPIRPERNTWKDVETIRSSKLTPVSIRAL